MKEVKLNEMGSGDSGKIKKIMGTGAAKKRLMDMGLVRSSEIKVIRTAPMGDPVEFEVKGYNLTLRKQDSEAVLVEVDE
jgi:ferrous iron transport protein A